MPRLTKGGKWVYGWCAVSETRELLIPPDAWREYGFETGQVALFGPGSSRSGGFCVTTPDRVAEFCTHTGGNGFLLNGRSHFCDGGRVRLPPQIHLGGAGSGCGSPRLLAVRGSCFGLGFVASGPIYEAALLCDELDVF